MRSIYHLIRENLSLIPFYIVLLPCSFVLHGYIEHSEFMNITDAIRLSLIYSAFSVTVFIFSWIFFKDPRKAAVMTIVWMAIYLYFGAIVDFLRQQPAVHMISRYRYLLPAIVISLVWIFIYMKRTKRELRRITLYFNLLFIIYILVDAVQGFAILSHRKPEKIYTTNIAGLNGFVIPDSCNKPDIYLLLFDEYASSLSLKERYNFNNNIDSFLQASGFSVQAKSTSNYNSTPFSMASTLNMTYLSWVAQERGVDRKDFLECNKVIRNNSLIRFLDANGYDIVNLSVFDLADHPAKIEQSFLPLKGKIIAEGTMFPRLYDDFQSIFIGSELLSKLMGNDYFFRHISNNNMLLEEVVEQSRLQHNKPRFIYTHLYLPHEPFFFDRNGKRKSNKTLVQEEMNSSADAYLQYVEYSNTRIKPLIRNILENTRENACIIVLSDHGFRVYDEPQKPVWHFQNLNAVYLPGKDYHLFYDSVSNVNEFRIILNSLFKQNFPLLNDSSIYLLDRKFLPSTYSR